MHGCQRTSFVGMRKPILSPLSYENTRPDLRFRVFGTLSRRHDVAPMPGDLWIDPTTYLVVRSEQTDLGDRLRVAPTRFGGVRFFAGLEARSSRQ